MRNLIITILVSVLSATFLFASICVADQVKVFKINYRPADELLDLVKVGLSKSGSATVDIRTNSIVVRDNSRAIARVQKILSLQDTPPISVSISVYEVGKNDLSNLGVNVDWRVRNGQWAAGNVGLRGDGTFASVRGKISRHSSKMASKKWIKVLSGGRGTLFMGSKSAFSPGKIDYYEALGYKLSGVNPTQVQTGIEVTPIVTGKDVRLTLTPVVAIYSQTGVEEKRLESFALTVSIPDDGRLLVGSDDVNSQNVVSELFSGFSQSTSTNRGYLMLEVKVDRER